MIRLALLLALLALPATAQTSDPKEQAAQQKTASLPPLGDEVSASLQAVGRVNIAGFKVKGNCTGTLVAPSVVLTAAHCTGDPDVMTNSRVFVAGWNRGEFIAARKIRRVVRHPGYEIGSRKDVRFDVGLLFLEEPITEVAPLPLAPDRAGSVGLVGYHMFIPHLLSGRLDCPVLGRDTRLMRIDCPVVSGNSGGPILEPDGAGGWQVTGVVSSQERRPGILRAIAVRLPAWVNEVLAEQ